MGNNITCACDKGSDNNSEFDFTTANPDAMYQSKDQLRVKGGNFLQNLFRKKSSYEKLVDQRKEQMKLQRGNESYEDITEEEFESNVPWKVNEVLNRLSEGVEVMRVQEKTIINVNLGPMSNKKEKEFYWGEWNTLGEKTGLGKMIKEDGSVYFGFFERNKFDGQGVLVRENGDYYLGNWKAGVAEGKGAIVLSSQGIKYEGGFQDNMREGFGEEVYSDGAIFIGNYKNNEKEGEGTYNWSDGTKYSGSFTLSMLHGFGEMIWADGRSYKGYFAENKLHGKGEHRWPDGTSYEGTYSNGTKSGEGTFQWASDKVYSGGWMNNKQHGNGKVSIKGKSYLGLWRFGKVIRLSEVTSNGGSTE